MAKGGSLVRLMIDVRADQTVPDVDSSQMEES